MHTLLSSFSILKKHIFFKTPSLFFQIGVRILSNRHVLTQIQQDLQITMQYHLTPLAKPYPDRFVNTVFVESAGIGRFGKLAFRQCETAGLTDM